MPPTGNLLPDDLVQKINRHPVRTAEEFLAEVAKAESDPLRVQFVRNQQTMELDGS